MALMVLPWAPIAYGSLRDAPRPSESARPPSLSLPITADLDGDCRADTVSLLSNGFDKTIQIKFGNSRNSNLNFTAKNADRGIVFAYDINHDGYPDLIWVASSGQKTAVVLINDGQGNFNAARDNTPYISEITALLGSSDPSHQNSLQCGRQAQILTSSPSSDNALGSAGHPSGAVTGSVLFSRFDRCAKRPAFVPYLRKRGPPLFVS
jgi:hypothetical protein